jgi:hypothetical protein
MRIYVKGEVENYLEKSFYDLSTLNLDDCNTYNRMRTIATEKYGIHLTDPFLPDGSLDHGVDLIDIVRDLNREYGIFDAIPNRQELQRTDLYHLIYRICFSLQLRVD